MSDADRSLPWPPFTRRFQPGKFLSNSKCTGITGLLQAERPETRIDPRRIGPQHIASGTAPSSTSGILAVAQVVFAVTRCGVKPAREVAPLLLREEIIGAPIARGLIALAV